MKIEFDVKNRELNSSIISEKLFKILGDDDGIKFISVSTKENLLNYKREQSLENAKNLWEDILKDAICILKINDQREKLYKDTKKLIDKNRRDFHDQFTNIRNISSYGINEISDYFSDFVEFESVLYGIGDSYRDHIHHVLQVWGLGIAILWGIDQIPLKLSEGFEVGNVDFHFQCNTYKTRKSAYILSTSEIWSMWSIIALCHDLGYPLEKASQINMKVKKIITRFGCNNFDELNFNFDALNTFIVEKYLNIISSKTVFDKCNKVSCLKSDNGRNCLGINKANATKIQHKYYDKFSKSLEDYKHGILSGLLLFKKLTFFLETDFAPNKETLSCEDLRQFYIRKEILRAISNHTCFNIYHLELNTLSFILILCDELQEWGRPSFKDLLSGNKIENQKIKIKKIQVKKKTSFVIQLYFTNLKVGVSKEKEILENFVKKKFRNFVYLLRSAKGDSYRNILFNWTITCKNKGYEFSFDTKENSYNMFKFLEFDIENQKIKKGTKKSFNIY